MTNKNGQTDEEPGSAPPRSTNPVESDSQADVVEGIAADRVPIPPQLPVLPIRDAVVYPGTIVPLSISRPRGRKLLDESLPNSKVVALVTQRDADQDAPTPEDLYGTGCAAMVLKLVRQPDETVSIIVHGLRRIHTGRYIRKNPFFVAEVAPVETIQAQGSRFDAAIAQLRQQAGELLELTPNAPDEAMTVLTNIDDPSNLADFLAANLNLDVHQKQDLLDEVDLAKRVRAVHMAVSHQLDIVKLQQKIQKDVQSSITDRQRKAFLREQIKAIQKELGEDEDPAATAAEELRIRLDKANPPEQVLAESQRELGRLATIPPASPEGRRASFWRSASRSNLQR